MMIAEKQEARTYGRKAFGPQRRMTPQQKAQYVAESIAMKMDQDASWSWAQYGLEENPAQQALVRLALMGLR